MLSSKLNTHENHGAQSSTSGSFAGISSSTANILIFLFTGTIALFLALLWLPSTYVDNYYVPMGADSFYHARRILDLVNSGEFYQFDSKIHAPDGAFLTWPWLYDYLIAKLVTVLQHLFNITDAMYVIVRIPPFWAYINTLILLGISIQLRFSLPLRFLALLCFAISPLTQELHGAGRIDHHYMEFTMVLLTIFAGLYWFHKHKSIGRSITFGIILGLAPGINNGLFILQLPVLTTFIILWFKRQSLDNQSMAALGLSLITTTLLILAPSEPFHAGLNSYYYLSWFHLYVACSFSLIIAFFAKFPFSTKSFKSLLVLGFILAAPIVVQTFKGAQFLIGDVQFLTQIPEMQSMSQQISAAGLFSVITEYSGLLLVSPLILVIFFFKNKNNITNEHLFLLVMCVFGLTLLALQQRLNYFGSYALYLPIILLFGSILRENSHNEKVLWSSFILFLVIAYLPTLNHFEKSLPLARSFDYAATRQIYPSMHNACDINPGVVLASHFDGHYIRFHTNCSVIANNMVITPKDIKKVLLTNKLMSKSAVEITTEYPWINYVFVRRNDNIMATKPVAEISEKNKGLREELLLRGDNFPPRYKLIRQLLLKQANGTTTPIARLFEIKRSTVNKNL